MRKQLLIPAWFSDDLIRRATNLACILLSDKPLAIAAVVDALDKLDVRMAVQDKRGYYSAENPTKVRWSDEQTFQNLIIECTARIARSYEQHNSDFLITEEMMITRWIAYIIQIARD